MKQNANSPSKELSIKERVAKLSLYAESDEDAKFLAELNQFIEAGKLEEVHDFISVLNELENMAV